MTIDRPGSAAVHSAPEGADLHLGLWSLVSWRCRGYRRWTAHRRPTPRRPPPHRRPPGLLRRPRAGGTPPARIGEDAGRLGPGMRRAHALDLHHGADQLEAERAQLRLIVRSALGPALRCGVGIGRRPAVVGQGVGAPAVDLVARDEALVGELLEGGVDGPRARPPAAATLRLELLDDLVAVHRPGHQGRQDQRADLAPPEPAPAPATTAEHAAEVHGHAVGSGSMPVAGCPVVEAARIAVATGVALVGGVALECVSEH